MSKKPIRIAVVGLGKMGLLHTSILNILPNVELAAICEKNSFTRKIGKKVITKVPIVEDVNDFKGLNLDAVYITTPISSHYAVAKTIYQQELAPHVFMEKPLSGNADQSKELVDFADNSKGVNMVGYLRRFYVTFQKAKELLDSNAIGELETFQINAYSADFIGVHDPEESIARGGVLKDLGSYAIDMAYWYFKDFQLTSAKKESLTGKDAEDSVSFTVKQNNSQLEGEFSVSWCKEGFRMPEVGIKVVGSKGIVEVNDDQVNLTLNGNNKTTWYRMDLNDQVGFWLGNPEYYREDLQFVNAIKNGSLVEPSFKTSAKVDELIQTIQQKAN
ncbi:MAG: Gfo/Idh/MocA family protein [Candidatus Bathyarchaeia archaeon]|jgi:predicted dehydrogenase